MAASVMDYMPDKALEHPLLAFGAVASLAGVSVALRRIY